MADSGEFILGWVNLVVPLGFTWFYALSRVLVQVGSEHCIHREYV